MSAAAAAFFIMGSLFIIRFIVRFKVRLSELSKRKKLKSPYKCFIISQSDESSEAVIVDYCEKKPVNR